MKKTLTIIAALALVLGMTQCKKAETPQATTDEGIFVTFTASYGGERTSFDPTGCSFTWTNGATEHIYVGCEGMSGCIGELSATGNGSSNLTFTGTLTQTPANGATLHFFYLGKDKDGSAVTSLDFSNQDGNLSNLTNYHIAVGSQTYTTGMTNFSATLNPLVAFAYFDLSGFGTEAVSISGDGVYSTATIDYQNGKIAGNTKGSVSVGTPLSGGNYVALIPSTSVSSTDYATTVEFGNTGYSGSLEFKRGIFAGRYYTTANGDALEVAATSAAPDYVFTVDGEGTTVQFSPGNLQYTMSTSTWSFMENQYDIVETNDQNVGENYGNQNIVSLFAWGANGLSGVMPYSTDGSYWTGTTNLTLTGANPSDWGAAANAANLGGHNDWRTLTKDEWEWLLGPSGSPNPGTNCRDDAISLRGWKTVNEVNGLVILPDGCSLNISASTWDQLSAAGAVFLPATGYRSETDVYDVGDYGSYWSASPDEEPVALSLDFNESGVNPGCYCYRGDGLSVRLVR